MLQGRGNHGGAEQHIDQDVVELGQKPQDDAASPRFGQAVRPVRLQPGCRLGGCQSVNRRTLPLKAGFDLEGMGLERCLGHGRAAVILDAYGSWSTDL